jgi:hypothetical protein
LVRENTTKPRLRREYIDRIYRPEWQWNQQHHLVLGKQNDVLYIQILAGNIINVSDIDPRYDFLPRAWPVPRCAGSVDLMSCQARNDSAEEQSEKDPVARHPKLKN